MSDLRFALLIDADNISAKYISGILDEMTTHGITTYRRIYGDWTSTQATKWKEELLSNSIMPVQQFSNTVGKNATDSALIIDAMDILYTGKVDGFCIVSSDSDFTRLASRLRESGMKVIGMGENKTPQSFRSACTIFTNLENLIDDEESVKTDEESVKTDKGSVIQTIVGILSERENRSTTLAELGNRLVKKYPDFDVRSFGYSSLTKFVEDMEQFTVDRVKNGVTVSLKSGRSESDEIIRFLQEEIKKSGKKGLGISELSNAVRAQFDDFNLKQYGYSQMSKFIQSLENIEVFQDANKIKKARVK